MTDDSTRLAVLIDADNTPARLVKEMFEELAAYGTITVKRAYGDWTNPHLTNWRDVLLGNAISPQQQFAYTYGKNATDSALIIDAMDLLYSGNVEGFAIVSSDSDFTPLATRLRESGKRVIGVGQRKTPKAFVEACERFVFLEVLAGDSGASEPEPAKGEQPPAIESVLTKALNKVEADDDNWAPLSALGNHLNRTDPSFERRQAAGAGGARADVGAAQGSSTAGRCVDEDGSEADHQKRSGLRSGRKGDQEDDAQGRTDGSERLSGSVDAMASSQDLVDDARDRWGGVD